MATPPTPAPRQPEKIAGPKLAGELLALKITVIELGRLIIADQNNAVDFNALASRAMRRSEEIIAQIGHPELRAQTDEAIKTLLDAIKVPA